jgi:hypothetical protein
MPYGTDKFTVPTSAVVVESRTHTPMRYDPDVVGIHVKVDALLQLAAIDQLTPSDTHHLN